MKYTKPFATKGDALLAVANELADINDTLFRINHKLSGTAGAKETTEAK